MSKVSLFLVFAVSLTEVVVMTPPAAAQDPVRQLQDCRVIQNMASRLFCYDRIVDGLTAGAIVAPAPAPPAPVAVAPAQTAPARVPTPAAIPPSPTPQAAVPVARPTTSAQTAPTRSPAPPARTASVPTPAPQFGDDSLPAERRAQAKSDDDHMRAKISQVKKDRYGNAVVTLDNGQVWRQTEGITFNAPTGSDIVIKKGMLGSYFLAMADGNRSVRVKRVQ